MALITEDGTGLSNAESYISVADADAYFTLRNSPEDWTLATVSVKEAALRYATEWLDNQYNWYSSILNSSQALGFPRIDFFDKEGRIITGIPTKIKNATCEMALNYLKDDFSDSNREGIQSETVGSASITYRGGGKAYSFVKIMLKDYGTPNAGRNSVMYRA